MRLHDVLLVLAALEERGVRYAVFGAMAMAAHGLERATKDLDLFVASDAANVERLREAFHSVFDDPSIDEITAEDLQGDYPVIEYGPPEGDYTIDIVSRLGEAFDFDDLEIVSIRVGDTSIHVVSPETLYRMKRDTVRPLDRKDAERLRQIHDVGE